MSEVRAIDATTGEVVSPCSTDEARALTDRIKSHAEALWSLLLEAHDRQAWKALGYGTWNDYIAGEFAMSKQRSFQVLDQGRVIQAIRAASESTTVDLTEREARDIKPHLEEVTDQIRGRVESGEEPEAAISEVVETTRKQEVTERERRSAEVMRDLDTSAIPRQDPTRVERERTVINAIHALADIRNPDDLARGWSPHAAYHLDRLDNALAVLTEIRDARRDAA